MQERFDPLQHNQHVKDYDKWVVEQDQYWTKRLRGEGEPLNMNLEAVRLVIGALRRK